MKLRKKLIIFSILFLFGFGVFFGTFARGGYFVNAASDNYYYLGKYEETATTAGSGEQYKAETFAYIDYDNNKYKVVFRVSSLDAYLGDYSDFYLIGYRNSNRPYSQYNEHLLFEANETEFTGIGISATYEEITEGLQLTLIIDCDLSSIYKVEYYYENYENDNELEFYNIITIGYAPAMYENIIIGYENSGYNRGTQVSNEAQFWFVGLFEGFQRFLDIEIMGISIGTIILVPFAITFVWFIVRQFKGGGD